MSLECSEDLGLISHEKGNGCLQNSMSKQARIGLQYQRYGLHAPHKPRCELGQRNHLFSEFVARNGSLEGCDYACRDQPHVCVSEDLSWTLSKKIMASGE